MADKDTLDLALDMYGKLTEDEKKVYDTVFDEIVNDLDNGFIKEKSVKELTDYFGKKYDGVKFTPNLKKIFEYEQDYEEELDEILNLYDDAPDEEERKDENDVEDEEDDMGMTQADYERMAKENPEFGKIWEEYKERQKKYNK